MKVQEHVFGLLKVHGENCIKLARHIGSVSLYVMNLLVYEREY